MDGETLVVVLANHETGGLSLLDGNIEKGKIEANFSTSGHSGILVPVYAYGSGTEEFMGIYEIHTNIHKNCFYSSSSKITFMRLRLLKLIQLRAITFGIFCISFLGVSAQSRSVFQFHKDGTFKIVQFTDLHWQHGSVNCAETIETLKHVLDTENPDMVVITGDVITKQVLPKIFCLLSNAPLKIDTN